MFRVLLYNSTKTYECIQNASTYLFWMLLRQGQTKNKNQSLWLHLPMLPQVLQKSTPYSPQEKKRKVCFAQQNWSLPALFGSSMQKPFASEVRTMILVIQ